MIFSGDTIIVLFALAVMCVGVLAAGLIADGWGKFRADHREAMERFDQQAVANLRRKQFYVVPDPLPEGNFYPLGDRLVLVRSDPSPEQLERLKKAYQRRTGLYDHTTDNYV
jgi:hypothetical protein